MMFFLCVMNAVPPHLQGDVNETAHVKEGQDVELFCPVHATPPPAILWMKGSSILQETFITL